MRVILVAAEYRPEWVAKYLAASAADGWPSKGGVMCFEPDAGEKPVEGAALPPGCVRLVMSKYLANDGAFASVQLVKELAVVLAKEPATLVLDSTTSSTRYSDLDRHGHRAAEVPALMAKTLYWSAEPPVVIHFVAPTMKPYYVKEWGQKVEYAPVETLHVCGQDVAAVRIDPIWQRALAKRTIFTPRSRLKRFFRRAVVGRLLKFVPRISLFR